MLRNPQNFIIQISLDENNNFCYTELFNGKDATSIAVINGDKLAWVLDPAIEERTFQLDFGPINPFHLFRNISLRGDSYVVSDRINFPAAYPANRQLKYTVTLGMGWNDDPDVVPVENDSNLSPLGRIESDCKIVWADANDQSIALMPPAVQKSPAGKNAIVSWGWAVGVNDPTPPFTLTFEKPPAKWPQGAVHSTSVNPAITLALPLGSSKFEIDTVSGDGVNAIKALGMLTIA